MGPHALTSANPERSRFRFGDCELDVAAGELRRGGRAVPLRPKCFDLLLLFVSRSGELLSKELLAEEVWPDVVATDATLTRTVTELREALGDDAQNPVYIETVPRRGYRFIATVESEASQRPAFPGTPFVLISGTRHYPLAVGEHLMGRGREVTVPVLTLRASRHHARLRVTADSIEVEDLGSRNGTSVNGERIAGVVVVGPGDSIEIAGEAFVVWSESRQDAPTAGET
jgi:DNA-binding winged helix-turn-helix (wHTH) protein